MPGIALPVAPALDSCRLYGTRFSRISILLPHAVPAVVATLMWGFMHSTRFGLVGDLDERPGLSLPSSLSPDLVPASIGNFVTRGFVKPATGWSR
jgi:multiple sugar transport system permease protein